MHVHVNVHPIWTLYANLVLLSHDEGNILYRLLRACLMIARIRIRRRKCAAWDMNLRTQWFPSFDEYMKRVDILWTERLLHMFTVFSIFWSTPPQTVYLSAKSRCTVDSSYGRYTQQYDAESKPRSTPLDDLPKSLTCFGCGRKYRCFMNNIAPDGVVSVHWLFDDSYLT